MPRASRRAAFPSPPQPNAALVAAQELAAAHQKYEQRLETARQRKAAGFLALEAASVATVKKKTKLAVFNVPTWAGKVENAARWLRDMTPEKLGMKTRRQLTPEQYVARCARRLVALCRCVEHRCGPVCADEMATWKGRGCAVEMIRAAMALRSDEVCSVSVVLNANARQEVMCQVQRLLGQLIEVCVKQPAEKEYSAARAEWIGLYEEEEARKHGRPIIDPICEHAADDPMEAIRAKVTDERGFWDYLEKNHPDFGKNPAYPQFGWGLAVKRVRALCITLLPDAILPTTGDCATRWDAEDALKALIDAAAGLSVPGLRAKSAGAVAASNPTASIVGDQDICLITPASKIRTLVVVNRAVCRAWRAGGSSVHGFLWDRGQRGEGPPLHTRRNFARVGFWHPGTASRGQCHPMTLATLLCKGGSERAACKGRSATYPCAELSCGRNIVAPPLALGCGALFILVWVFIYVLVS